MNKEIARALDWLKQTIEDIEDMDSYMQTGEYKWIYKWSWWKCPIVAWMELPEPHQK